MSEFRKNAQFRKAKKFVHESGGRFNADACAWTIQEFWKVPEDVLLIRLKWRVSEVVGAGKMLRSALA